MQPIVHAFICGPGDDWMLPHHLRVYSQLCDRVFVVLDRTHSSEAICKRFPKVEVRHAPIRPPLPMGQDGVRFYEGLLRQQAWDFATECNPSHVLLGDTDEVPTPHAADWILDRFGSEDAVDCFYADWVNLIHDATHAIGGTQSPWSYQVPTNNKKGFIARHVKGREYRYQQGTRHVRMEPNPLSESLSACDDNHRLGLVPLLHYRWANWPRWERSEYAKLPAYQPWPDDKAKIVNIPHHWLWRWSAEDLIRRLPEPIAVVGNGPCQHVGHIIDSHATVIRFNNWTTQGHEASVGEKTTVWCRNLCDDVEDREWTGDMLTIVTHEEKPEAVSKYLGMYPHMHVPRESWAEMTRGIKPQHPSTGLVLLNRLRLTGKRFNVYGFDGMKSGHYFNLEHKHNHPPETDALARLGVVPINDFKQ